MADLLTKELLDKIIDIAREAGAYIKNSYDAHSSKSFETKTDGSPLTDADLGANQIIVTALAELTPTVPIISEESQSIDFKIRQNWEQYWVVDPLDGTQEYLAGNGEFTVNIALIKNHEPVLGVIMVPVTGVVYYAARGIGAYKSEDGKSHPIKSRAYDGKDTMVVTSRRHGVNRLGSVFNDLGHYRKISVGSSLKFCLIAEGRADIYPRLSPTCEWDTAAAQAIVELAGGQVITLDEKRLMYNNREQFINSSFVCIGDAQYPWAEHLTIFNRHSDSI